MAQKIRENFPKNGGPVPYQAIFSGDIPYIPLAQKGLKKKQPPSLAASQAGPPGEGVRRDGRGGRAVGIRRGCGAVDPTFG